MTALPTLMCPWLHEQLAQASPEVTPANPQRISTSK
jgi:hypothetical protein